MITLCEECFSGYADVQPHTTVPLTTCAFCGRRDDRGNGGLHVNMLNLSVREFVDALSAGKAKLPLVRK